VPVEKMRGATILPGAGQLGRGEDLSVSFEGSWIVVTPNARFA
jgi:hypothetical protein